MNQQGSDPRAHYALTRHLDDRHRIVAPAWQSRASATDGRTRTTVEITNHRRSGVIVTIQPEGILRDHVKTREPHAGLAFTALRNDVLEDIELHHHSIELGPRESKFELRPSRMHH